MEELEPMKNEEEMKCTLEKTGSDARCRDNFRHDIALLCGLSQI